MELNIPSTRFVTVASDRAFAVSAARVWNGLPPDVMASSSKEI